MSRKATSQAANLRALAEGWSKDAADRLRRAVKATGRTQGEVAPDVPISRQRLSGILSGEIHPSQIAFMRICEVVGMMPSEILTGVKVEQTDVAEEVVSVPRLLAVASAGNGVVAEHESLAASPFYLVGSWLRQKFGTVTSLRVVQVNGSSQEPDLRDGDWVMIDESKNAAEDGLAVVRLDDGLLVKRIQREGYTLHLLSKNPIYQTTTLDLRKDEERFRVIGKVVYSFRTV
jgi:SOS-response transcriptional repressor LexA